MAGARKPMPSSAPPDGRVRRLGAKSKVEGEHGLPKPELLQARLTVRGVEGDYNLYRETKRGGDPDMALLLLPEETIDDLNRDGWPVRPGDLGENVTTSGIAYVRLTPPRQLRLGEVVVQTTKPCEPCDNLCLLPYVGRERGAAFLRAMLGRRGWFAKVVREGVVRKGDAIELIGGP